MKVGYERVLDMGELATARGGPILILSHPIREIHSMPVSPRTPGGRPVVSLDDTDPSLLAKASLLDSGIPNLAFRSAVLARESVP